MSKKLAVIILPMYNEALSIALLRKMFDEDFSLPAAYDHRIVAVDDGSKDDTLQMINHWAYENKRVVVLSHTRNMGVGQALLTGFREAIRMNAHFAVTLDADASHPGNIISLMLEKCDAGADIVIASRFAAGGKQVGVPPLRQVYSAGARILLTAFFPLKGVRDYTVGFRAYGTPVLYRALSQSEESFLKFRSFACSVEILLKVATKAGNIEEVPLVLRYDHKVSPSKLKLWLTIKDYLKLFLLPKQACPLGRGLKI